MSLKVLILGVNGFIGSSLTERILADTDWHVYGMDIGDDKVSSMLDHPRFHFVEGDITISREWIEYHVKKCDVVLPLVAIANPTVYVNDPLRVFELDFEANLPIVRQCVRYKKRLVFPSTSEVYGMGDEAAFDEETSNFVLGPINKQRWIYSCAKQMMDRIIFAYGVKEELDYTLFRPFNWVGPKLDSVYTAKEGNSRATAQFIGNIFRGLEVKLVDGGSQRRCFTDIDDGIDALMRIIENKDGCATRRIFNVGNPDNDYSIADLAAMLMEITLAHPKCPKEVHQAKIVTVDAQAYFGQSYQDTASRVPSIEQAKKYLGWTPKVDLRTALTKTIDYHLNTKTDVS